MNDSDNNSNDKKAVEPEKAYKSGSSLSEHFEPSPKEKKKIIIIEVIVSFLIVSAMFAAVALTEIYSLKLNWSDYSERMRILCDSFFVSGIMGILSWLLILVARQGGFDMIVYGVRKAFLWTFSSKKHAREALPATFYDYVMEKKGKKYNSLFPMFIVFGTFLAISIVFMFLAL